METISECTHLAKHAPAILRAFLSVVGDNFDNDVNLHAITGLARVIAALPEEVVVANLTEIIGKVFPFFDNSRNPSDSAAAMTCVGNLSEFVSRCRFNQSPALGRTDFGRLSNAHPRSRECSF
jgi:hypothetical protein